MLLLILFAFIAGIITVLSPCILPVLPIVLSSSIGGQQDRSRPWGVVTGFVLSFTFFTLFLSTIVSRTNISANSLRTVSVIVIATFGLTLLIPAFQKLLEKLFSFFSRFAPNGATKTGFAGGAVVGASLGLLWTPCVGPILASVITLAITGTVSFSAIAITAAYATGTAIPMLFIIKGGQKALQKVPWLLRNTGNIQKVFGVIMILVAIAIYANFDRKFQTYILQIFPNYGTGLTKLEEIAPIQEQLENLRGNGSLVPGEDMGKPTMDIIEDMSKGPMAPEIIPGGEWFNSEPLTLASLRGKVVLVDFWTYSCINCQRTFPYLRNWWETYKDQDFVIIGVHSPEFEFEKDADNVAEAIADFDLTYPIVQDNNFETWKAYRNRYWPAKYLIDKNGIIRYTHYGEGDYKETEDKIRELLLEEETQVVLPEYSEQTEYTIESRTPEVYLGYGRMQLLASPENVVEDQPSSYTAPETIPYNRFALDGTWTITEEYSQPAPGSKLLLHYEARNVFLVLNPVNDPGQVDVYLDGEFVQEITVDSNSLYELISQPSPGVHLLELRFPEGGVRAFAFTFG